MDEILDRKINTLKTEAKRLWDEQKQLQSISLYEQICQLEPEKPSNWIQLGSIYAMNGNAEIAIKTFEHAHSLDPKSADIYFNLAKVHFMVGHFDDSIENYRKALSLQPNWILALDNLGSAYSAIGNTTMAIKCYQKILAIKPDYTDAMLKICDALIELEKIDDAIEGYKRILAMNPGDPTTLSKLGTTLMKLGRYDEIFELCQYSKKHYPNSPEPYAIEAKVYAIKGNWKQAFKILEPQLKKHALNYQIVETFYKIARPANKIDKAIALHEKLIKLRGDQLEIDKLYILHHNLGKLYDSKHQYDKAFSHFKIGNEMRPSNYSAKTHDDFVNRTCKSLTKVHLNNYPKSSTSSMRPVFILGMPRSGTSLTEQIIDNHSQVTGGGELYYIDTLSKKTQHLSTPSSLYPNSIARLTTEDLDNLCAEYLSKTDKISSTSRHITDKMPQNFLHLGLIAKLFPNAYIINCQRDPLDTCLSCYFQDFSIGLSFSQNLNTLAHYYQAYEKLMKHWHSVIDNPILDFKYEELITDPEKSVRKLLNFLDLEWEENCLSFHKNKRIVATQSHDQVRQPLYNNSVERWRNYEKHIQPLLDILGTEH